MSVELTDKQKRAIRDKDHPHITLSVEEAADVEVGQVITLKPNQLSVTILGVAKDKQKKLYLRYSVRDDRPRLLRSSPHSIDFGDMRRRLDEYGTPRAVSEQDADEASETSGYTDSMYQALEDAGEAVPAEYQNELTLRARSRHLESVKEERMDENARQDVQRLNAEMKDLVRRAAKMGVDPMVALAPVAREIAAQHRGLSMDEAA